MVKVTREVADTIHKSYDALRLDNVKPKEALEIIHSDVEEDFGVKIGLGTVRTYACQTFDNVRESLRKYHQSEKGKETRRRYYQKHPQKLVLPRNPEIDSILDVFPDDDTELTAKQAWEKFGGNRWEVHSYLNNYAKLGVLVITQKRPKKYKRNPESSYYVLCDGKYEEVEREMFGEK